MLLVKKRCYLSAGHLDFDNATEYVKSLELMDLPKNYLRLTDSQEEKAEKNGDNISSIKKDDPQ